MTDAEKPFRSERSIKAELDRKRYEQIDKLLDAVLDRTITVADVERAVNTPDGEIAIPQGVTS